MLFWTMISLLIFGVILYLSLSNKVGMQKEYRDGAQGLADLVRYAYPVADGVMLGKGGELIAGFYYRGTDTESASNAELEGIAARLNAIFARLGTGWMIHIDAIRASAIGYAPHADFNSAVAELMDEERRFQYEQEGSHYESMYAIVFTYLPPLKIQTKMESMLYEQSKDLGEMGADIHNDLVLKFQQNMVEIESQLQTIFDSIVRLKVSEIKNQANNAITKIDHLHGYLHYCVTGINQYIAVPKAGIFADSIIASQDFTGGNHPKIGDKHIRVVSIEGFPSESYPTMLDALNNLPVAYRWSTRFIFLDPEESRNILDKLRKQWRQKVRGFKDQLMGTQSGAVDEDALEMMMDAQTAMSEVNAGGIAFGHYTSNVILMDDDIDRVEESVLECLRLIRNLGFTARPEGVNSVEAYLGSLPAHGYENVRRPIIHSLNLTHLIPTTASWAGVEFNQCAFYPPKSPPLLYGATTGSSPFRLSLHVGDVGHTLIIGTTGSGKSTLLELIQAQHLRYPDARIFKFDKGYSSFVLCNALGGDYYDIGGENQSIAFCPLQDIDKPSELIWAEGYIEMLLKLQDVQVTPYHKQAIRQALLLLKDSAPDRRSMTEFVSALQDHELQTALSAYTLAGNNEMLDATHDNISLGRYSVFEMEHLMNMGNKHATPVLLYIFRCIERQLDGSPTIIILDEAWLAISNEHFKERIREWMKVMRKANTLIVFATQSISDIGKSDIRDVLYESCPTKILLPNAEARSNQMAIQQYELLGLNDRQIDLIAHATPKRDYYYLSPLGKRMFRLGLDKVCLAFVGASGKKDIALARELIESYGDRWVIAWLEKRGLPKAAEMLASKWKSLV